jgi:undecaprenyl-diphosphatase
MGNIRLFELLNASGNIAHWKLAALIAIATGLIYIVPLALVAAWLRGDAGQRRALLEMLLAVGLALGIGQAITMLWPQPRPFMVHLGTQFIAHAADPGLPSDHVTVLWALACAALWFRSFRSWALALFPAGLLVGWSRVVLGVHFPYDVLGALPVAWAGSMLAVAARPVAVATYARVVDTWERVAARC